MLTVSLTPVRRHFGDCLILGPRDDPMGCFQPYLFFVRLFLMPFVDSGFGLIYDRELNLSWF